ncbi:MAG: peptide deformylase [Campylobacter sp.]|nr:peptide deformylase [Campylobacter sp.]
MTLEVLTYPNKKLYEKSKEVTKFDENLHKFLDDMYETMIASKGIGLAAIQVGNPIRAIVINLVGEDDIQHPEDKLELINPVITHKDGEIVFQEGCLSVPGFYEDVKRAGHIKLAYQDRDGKSHQMEADELLGVCIQHEIDHLNGHLFIEYIGYNQKKRFQKEFKKNQK